MSRPPSFGPLDTAAAELLAHQLRTLSDPVAVQLLSHLVARTEETHSAVSLAAGLSLTEAVTSALLSALQTADLVEPVPGTPSASYRPTPDTWIRFGRLLSGKTAYREPVPAATPVQISELPSSIQKTAERIAYRFSSSFSKETVERYVVESYELLRDRANVTNHLPSLTTRFATDRLTALAAARGMDLRGTPEVLFVCVQNSGRSQIAAGLLRQLSGDRVNVRTAGSAPAASIDEMVVTVLDEIGIPLVSEFPKPLTDEVVQAADVVVTMGCGDACPVYPGRLYLDWPVEDPAGAPIEDVRVIRDDIARRVVALLQALGMRVAND